MASRIKGISYYLPEKKLTNEELCEIFEDYTPEKIYEKTGIRSRRIANSAQCVSDLAVESSLQLFEEYKISPNDIDFILLATQSPDYSLPTTACIVQDRLGIPTTAGALDYNLGCSAFVYGLALCKGILSASIAKNILLITAETYSKYINPMDKSVRTIFGDGAAATLVSHSEDEGIGQFILNTDGSGWDKLIVPASGMRIPKSDLTKIEVLDDYGNVRNAENIYMNGPDIFSFTLKVVPKAVKEVLEKNNTCLEDIDLFVFHQANVYMLEHLRKKCEIPQDRFYVNMSDTGNTVSASIPIALKMAEQEGKLKPGFKVLLVGFGVGLSFGAAIIQW